MGAESKKFKTFDEFLEHHGGDADKAARAAFRTVQNFQEDVHELREDKRELKNKLKTTSDELDDLKSKAPKEGQELMTDEVKAELEGFRALGKLADLKEELPRLREKATATTLIDELTKANVPADRHKTAISLINSGGDAYFTEKEETDSSGKKTKTRVLDVKKLYEDHPILGELPEGEGAEDEDAGEPQGRKVIPSATPKKAGAKSGLEKVGTNLAKNRYPGPKK